jgi:pyruvate,orthophosphate dikinase
MMDTVLNLGIDADGEAALAAETGSATFARDTHRRFLALYAEIVLKAECGALDPAADAQAWRAAMERAAGAPVPTDPRAHLTAAILAVFESWNSRRAKRYRAHHGIADDLGTAVTVQAMVFGNLDEASGTGVLFSRNPLTGHPAPFGEYLPRAQGEDVVSGRFTPLPLEAMRMRVPAAHDALLAASRRLEKHHADIQDIEFTVQRGTLYLLQTRAAKRSAEAAARLAVDMVDEGLIDEDTALARVSAEQIATLLQPKLTRVAMAGATVIARGEGACPGAAIGIAVGDPDEAERRAALGEDIILVRATTSPDDIHGMIAARGIITAHGGATSHAAVVSRALGRPCVVGAGQDAFAHLGEIITVDGEGVVYEGALAVEAPDEAANPVLARLITWARARSPIEIYAEGTEDTASGAVVVTAELALDPDRLAAALQGATHASGAALAIPSVAAIAARAGVRSMTTSPVLPALLSVIASGGT